MRFLLLALLGVSSMAVAHPGHDQIFHSSLLAGMAHPLTGLDHLIMAVGLGLLMARSFKQGRVAGLGIFLIALLAGFALGVQHLLSNNVAEYGIVASLMVLAVALWQRVNSMFLPMLALLGVFHGMAHGNELAQGVEPALFMAGMMITLTSLYMVGLMLAGLFKQHVKLGDRAVAILASIVALLGLA